MNKRESSGARKWQQQEWLGFAHRLDLSRNEKNHIDQTANDSLIRVSSGEISGQQAQREKGKMRAEIEDLCSDTMKKFRIST
ncbi:hypothetical protein Pyn_07479 [Prunus yedoensis var. nudiflora]|uniref:Uncharacterized protein n=1 Tax=Prunus yedoensis var. nudiflora TaxID=2094558 RepID=A0A314ZZ90_PRUYE|nr:hypothetical protein Pyn_07479 [Prunus yedoensis var. nudiflora]